MTIADRKLIARRLTEAKRLVVKVGSALLVDAEKGRLNRAWLESFAADVAAICASAAKRSFWCPRAPSLLGRRHLGLSAGKLKLEESQAAAAVGQIRLAHAYKELLDAHEITVAQILLTLGDTEQRRRYLNARGTLEHAVVPGRGAGDQRERHRGDRRNPLRRQRPAGGARGANGGRGLSGPAVRHRRAVHGQPQRRTLTRSSLAGFSRSRPPSRPWRAGRAATWVRAACRRKLLPPRLPWGRGVICASPRGRVQHPLQRIEEGARCTWFVPSSTPLATRKQWIAGTLRPAGAIVVDDGAVRALMGGKSLLPAGVTRAVGRFDRGDTVSIIGPDGSEVARGICAYSDGDAARIIGRKSADIEKVLGFRGRDEIVHRDDLVLIRAHVTGSI